ncbi:hypothetical protein JB92DRAFT_3108809 [Gautieria morchelliformis]|nr:hypothetical protein JB92DRAFT_3108809 [Gautieria morchelliformis]
MKSKQNYTQSHPRIPPLLHISSSTPSYIHYFVSSPVHFLFSRNSLHHTVTSYSINGIIYARALLSPRGYMAVPLLTFTDRKPTFSVLTTGLLEINKGIERQLGVDPGFWVAYLDFLKFLTERDSLFQAENAGVGDFVSYTGEWTKVERENHWWRLHLQTQLLTTGPDL